MSVIILPPNSVLTSCADVFSTLTDPRKAFANRDVEASQRAHEIRMRNIEAGEPLEENHGNIANEYLKSIVYGGLDGIITTFATVTSVAGAHFSSVVVIVLGISHLFADGLSMVSKHAQQLLL